MPATIAPSMIPVVGASFVRPITIGDGIRLYGSSSGYVGLKPAAAAGSTDYTLPSADGTSGQVLSTNGSGVLSWATVSGASPSGSGTELQYRSGASTFGAVTGSSTANGGIAIQSQSASTVPWSVGLASGHTANALEISSYGNTGGNLFKVGASGFVYAKCFLTQSTYLIISDNGTPGFGYNGLSLRASGVDIRAGSASLVGWTATTDSYNNAFSVALGYSVAGVIEINNGTAGTYRDLKLRHLVSTGQAYCPQQTLTDAASISWDLDTQPSAVVTLADNRTLAAPTNQKAGATYILLVKQDATGSRTLTFNAVYKFSGGTAPTLTTTANAVDILTFISDGTYMYGVCQNDLR